MNNEKTTPLGPGFGAGHTAQYITIAESLRQAFVTVHSRNAWQETFQTLSEHGLGPVCFHYFTAGAAAAETVAAKGHYFSVNRRMLNPTGRHAEVVGRMPRHRVLVESDPPFLGERTILQDLDAVYRHLAALGQVELDQAIQQIRINFAQCRTERRRPALE